MKIFSKKTNLMSKMIELFLFISFENSGMEIILFVEYLSTEKYTQ